MRVLITGARGFLGKNLAVALKNAIGGSDECGGRQFAFPVEVYECDTDTPEDVLQEWCSKADFVFHLAGVNRSENEIDFFRGNCDFTSKLIEFLEESGNRCPVMLSSSVQASLEGRYAGSAYGKSKLESERIVFGHARRTGSSVLVYRFPNLYGKWCRPNYNSVVATFCFSIARDLPIVVDDPSVELQLVYIDDVIDELMGALKGKEHRCNYLDGSISPQVDGCYCYVPAVDTATVGCLAEMIRGFKNDIDSAFVSDLPPDSFKKKLCSTFCSYLDPVNLALALNSHCDERGSFTEVLKSISNGQVSINVSRPGVTKGNHWHHSKWEKFCVISGEGVIRLRGIDEVRSGAEKHPVTEYYVGGSDLTVVTIPPGYTHNIENLSEVDDMVTLMWANEVFDPAKPDTFYEEV